MRAAFVGMATAILVLAGCANNADLLNNESVLEGGVKLNPQRHALSLRVAEITRLNREAAIAKTPFARGNSGAEPIVAADRSNFNVAVKVPTSTQFRSTRTFAECAYATGVTGQLHIVFELRQNRRYQVLYQTNNISRSQMTSAAGCMEREIRLAKS